MNDTYILIRLRLVLELSCLLKSLTIALGAEKVFKKWKCILSVFTLSIRTYGLANSADPDEMRKTWCLIRVNTVCHTSSNIRRVTECLLRSSIWRYFSSFSIKIRCGYSLVAPHRDAYASNEDPQHTCLWRTREQLFLESSD